MLIVPINTKDARVYTTNYITCDFVFLIYDIFCPGSVKGVHALVHNTRGLAVLINYTSIHVPGGLIRCLIIQLCNTIGAWLLTQQPGQWLNSDGAWWCIYFQLKYIWFRGLFASQFKMNNEG